MGAQSRCYCTRYVVWNLLVAGQSCFLVHFFCGFRSRITGAVPDQFAFLLYGSVPSCQVTWCSAAARLFLTMVISVRFEHCLLDCPETCPLSSALGIAC